MIAERRKESELKIKKEMVRFFYVVGETWKRHVI